MTFTAIAIFLLILCSAIFSGSETALTAASKAQMHEREKNGEKRATTVNALYAAQEKLIGTILLGNNLVNILASALATSLFLSLFGEAGIAYATLSMTFLVLVFAEILPKTYALRNPNKMALFMAPIMYFLVKMLGPFVLFLQWIVEKTLFIFGMTSTGEEIANIGLTEIRGAINLHSAEEIKEEKEMLKSVLDLADVEVRDIMHHRRHMVSVNLDLPLDELLEQVLSCPYTRIPVWRKKPENIIGVLHTKQLARTLQSHKDNTESIDIEALSAKPWFILETTTLLKQLQAFRSRREHFAIVVDEYGAIMGIVTLEDVIEEIVGDITDEHDVPVSGVRPQPDGTYVVDGRVTIRDLNRQFDWELPDEDAATIAGLLLHETERIPEAGLEYSFYNFKFTVIRRQRNQIMAVRIMPPNDDVEE